jgi:ABC-2 type transport system permease protein
MDLAKQFISYQAILRREIFRIMRIWPQTLCPSLITALMNLLIFGKVIGAQLSASSGSYINFIIPGLVMMAIIINAYENTVSSFFVPKYMRSIEELLVSPTPDYIIILGYISAGVLRGLFIGSLVYLMAKCFTSIEIAHPELLFLVSLLVAIIFALGGLINAFLAKAFDDIAWFSSFVLTPMIFLGGVFYPIEKLSGIWLHLSHFNPLFYLIELFRACFVVKGDHSMVLNVLGLVIVLLFAISMRLLKYCVRK